MKVSFWDATKSWNKDLWHFISTEGRDCLLLTFLLAIFPGLFIGLFFHGHYWYSLIPVLGEFFTISIINWLDLNKLS
jgi:hypothetical protein